MMKIKVFERLWIHMWRDKASSCHCWHKGPGAEKARYEHWNGKEEQLPIPSSGKGLLWRMEDSLETSSPTWAPRPSCYPGLSWMSIAGPWCCVRGVGHIDCYPWFWTIPLSCSSKSQPGCKSQSMEKLDKCTNCKALPPDILTQQVSELKNKQTN